MTSVLDLSYPDPSSQVSRNGISDQIRAMWAFTASPFAETELWPEHLEELLASSPPSLSFDFKFPFFMGNWHTEWGLELFETLNPKVTATQSGTGVRAGKTRANLDDCMESVALVCHGPPRLLTDL